MKAVIVTEFGGPDRLQLIETADPRPEPGQCVVEVEACDVLFLDTMLRRGLGPDAMRPKLPWIPGNGVAGRVVSVGRGVPIEWVGRVVGAHTGGQGAYAQFVAVAMTDAVPIPDGVDVLAGAALLHDAPTALKLVEVTGISCDDAVLVLGASGGLGLMLVQLARARAARVIAVARDAKKRERIATFGPDAVIDPDDPEWVRSADEALRPGGATVILDNVGDPLGPQAFALLAEKGRFSAHATHGGEFTILDPAQVRARRATVTGIEQVQLPGDELARLTGQSFVAAANGQLKPVIGQTFPLQQVAEAHCAIESRRVFGKTLLTTAP